MNRQVLASVSGFFNAMFNGPWSDATGKRTVHLPEVDSDVFAYCAEYTTQGSCHLESDEMLLPVLEAAVWLQLSSTDLQ